MRKFNNLWAGALLTTAAVMVGCDSNGQSGGTGASTGQTQPASWLLTEAPESWEEIAAIKPTIEAGESVVLRGRIGGRVAPIAASSPTFVMMDPSVPSCADDPDDHCPTPWDYCCTDPKVISASNATVIVLDKDGSQTKLDLVAAGLSPMDEVIVVGTVDARPNQSVLTIRATGIYKVERSG